MKNPTIHLDEATLARAKQLAAERHCTVEELLRRLVEESSATEPPGAEDIVGILADEPEVVDEIMDDIYRTRETLM